MPDIRRVGDFSLMWGESLRWDDRRNRLYFVDCATNRLHWLDGLDDAESPLQTMQLDTLPTGMAPTEDGRLVIALGDGLHLIDPDAGTTSLLTPYPAELGLRANDAAADLQGNLVTGTLNLAEGPGSYWWFSSSDGWRQLDDGIGNANGPVVLDVDSQSTLVFADTPASAVYAYDYDGARGAVGPRRLYADTKEHGGQPDGACGDSHGGVWGCVLGSGKLARYTAGGTTDVIDTGVEYPSDVTFGGANLDRMFFVSIAVTIGPVEVTSPNAGALMVIENSGYHGRPEPRFRL